MRRNHIGGGGLAAITRLTSIKSAIHASHQMHNDYNPKTNKHMPRIEPLTIESADGESKELMQSVKQNLGTVPNVMATMAHSPAVLKTYLQWSQAMEQANLSQSQQEKISLAISQKNQCQYCCSAHTAIGKQMGIDENDILQAREGKSEDAKTQAAITFALKCMEKNGFVSDSDCDEAKQAGLFEGEICEVVALVAKNTLTNYLNHVSKPDIDFPQVEL